tara:strand:- start:10224 stop:10766 length:543 start_codon:yes stop_codon:yes gene_type:complete
MRFNKFFPVIITTTLSFTIQNNINSKIKCYSGYIPDGLTPKEWEKIKITEKNKFKNKNYAENGAKTFTSRSFKSFQTALEKGEKAKNFPIFNAKEKLKNKEIRNTDIPYMQRVNGKWDNSDIVKINSKYRIKKTNNDKDYENNPKKWLFPSFFKSNTPKPTDKPLTYKEMWKASGAKFKE